MAGVSLSRLFPFGLAVHGRVRLIDALDRHGGWRHALALRLVGFGHRADRRPYRPRRKNSQTRMMTGIGIPMSHGRLPVSMASPLESVEQRRRAAHRSMMTEVT